MLSSFLLQKTEAINIYKEEEIQGIREACKLAARCLDIVTTIIKPGTTTEEIDDFVFNFGIENNAIPASLNYKGYRKSCCTSINHVVCHGIPSNKSLLEGDIINVDVTYILNGWHGDTSRMYPVGKIKRAAERILQATYESLYKGIEAVKPNGKISDIGKAIQEYAHSQRCSVVKDFCGHGIGKSFHEKPEILHYYDQYCLNDISFQEGMVFTIEPMLNLGSHNVKVLSDGWTAVTRDKSLSAQYEHTVGVTKTGCEIFTSSLNGLGKP
ncbi:type I methionyl aminopeptidase [Candidatus Liberibacter americanus]|uniref:Methionine aminopeptidase n=1 Tax=Candidatus Liberibacter americanus str. Sao Paulo TaxID=1261131 RepID=U6B7Q0_9HYPH|nr:type I methionyl aminopeptidase [Candidatus Liberibacter americanus]AHA27891.1 Methionine aminopeptidase [Candidatus Liberibacter americanus str. Sao Paulo]EMS36112.1 methionine aminopeptidase [Candidatus Liberibacter americanus PW_SP]